MLPMRMLLLPLFYHVSAGSRFLVSTFVAQFVSPGICDGLLRIRVTRLRPPYSCS